MLYKYLEVPRRSIYLDKILIRDLRNNIYRKDSMKSSKSHSLNNKMSTYFFQIPEL